MIIYNEIITNKLYLINNYLQSKMSKPKIYEKICCKIQ